MKHGSSRNMLLQEAQLLKKHAASRSTVFKKLRCMRERANVAKTRWFSPVAKRGPECVANHAFFKKVAFLRLAFLWQDQEIVVVLSQ